jgi:uncharacterized protein YcfL
MKKLFFIFAASMLFVACGQKETQSTEEVTQEVILEEVVVDSTDVEAAEFDATEEVAE